MANVYQDALELAHRVAQEAGALLVQSGGLVGHVRTKSNSRDLVTEWDARSEELIVKRLQSRTPDIPIQGEETGVHGARDQERKWLVDPIDGTVNFAHGVPFFAVAISLEERGVPVAGVVFAPVLDWMFAAAKGNGATCNGSKIRVSETQELAASILASGFPYDRATSKHNFRQWEHFQCVAGACRRFGAASLDLCMVARGWLDGYWETRLSPWDLSAGALIAQEAGGIVTGIDGNVFSSDKGHAIASNGAIHDQILSELAIVGMPNL